MTLDTLKLKTVETLDKTEVVEFYQTLLQQQSDNYSNLITLLLGLTTILVGSSVLWNFVVSKNQIKNEINSLTDNLKTDNLKFITEQIDKRFINLDKEMKRTMKMNEANLSRLYAINAGRDGFLISSVYWWLTSLRVYNELEEQVLVRVCVDSLMYELQKPEWVTDNRGRFDPEEAIATINSCIPDILTAEKKLILEKVKQKGKIE